jgi:TonB family protein
VILDAGATIPPQIVRQGKIEVPAELKARPCKSGTAVVEVEVEVGATGRVQEARVQRASSEPAFDAACVRSAQSSEYQPATSHGTPTVGVTRIECKLECP